MAVPVPAGKRTAGIALYNLGRTLSYMTLGLVFSLLGATFQLSGLQQYFAAGLGIILLLFAILPVFGKKIEKSLYASGLLGRIRRQISQQFKQRTYSSTLLVGFLNGYLPCGMVYLAIAGAVTAGDPLDGVLYMAVFSFGTLPAMVTMMYAKRLLPGKLKINYVMLLSVALGLILLYRGVALDLPELSHLMRQVGMGKITVCGQ